MALSIELTEEPVLDSFTKIAVSKPKAFHCHKISFNDPPISLNDLLVSPNTQSHVSSSELSPEPSRDGFGVHPFCLTKGVHPSSSLRRSDMFIATNHSLRLFAPLGAKCVSNQRACQDVALLRSASVIASSCYKHLAPLGRNPQHQLVALQIELAKYSAQQGRGALSRIPGSGLALKDWYSAEA